MRGVFQVVHSLLWIATADAVQSHQCALDTANIFFGEVQYISRGTTHPKQYRQLFVHNFVSKLPVRDYTLKYFNELTLLKVSTRNVNINAGTSILNP